MKTNTEKLQAIKTKCEATLAKNATWQDVQDILVRQILAEMGNQRMNAKTMCKAAGISASHWNKLRDLKKPMSIDRLCAIGNALGIYFKILSYK